MSTSDQLRTHAQMTSDLEFIQSSEVLKAGSLVGSDGINRALERLARNSDALLDAVQASRNMFIVGGGTLAWAHGSGAFTRSDTLLFLIPNEVGTAGYNTLASGVSLSLTTNGSVAYAVLDRENDGAVLSTGIAATIGAFVALITGNNNRLDYQILAYRDDTTLVLWDGRRILTGESLTVDGSTDTQYGQQSEVTLVHTNQKENLQTLLHGGGMLSWDSGTETFTWTQELLLAFPSYAGENNIPADSLVIPAGEFAALTLTRAPGASEDVSGTLSSVADGSVTLGDDVFVLAHHNATDGRLYLWDGTALSDGDYRRLGGTATGIQFHYAQYPAGGIQPEDLTEGGTYPARSYQVGTGALLVFRNGVKAKASSAYWSGAYPTGSLTGSISAGDDYVEEDGGDGTGNRIIWLRDDVSGGEMLSHPASTHTIAKTWPTATDWIEALVGLHGESGGTGSLGIYPEPGGGPLTGLLNLKAGTNVVLTYDLANNAIEVSAASAGSTPIETISSTPRPVVTGDVDGTIFAADTSIGAISMALEASPAQDRRLIFKNMGASNLTLGRNGNNIEGGAADYVLASLESATLVYDGSLGWMVL
jgi:hypothetical protein